MLLQRRDAPAPRLSRTAARLPKALDPDNRRAGTDINLLGRRAPRRPAFNFRNHSRPHVFRIGLRHRPASQNRINADRLSHPSPSENLLDSIGTEHALVHTSLAQLRVTLMVGNELNKHWDTLCSLASSWRPKQWEPSLDHWGFAVQTAMALIVIVLFTLTFSALEGFLLGDESLSALEAAIEIAPEPAGHGLPL